MKWIMELMKPINYGSNHYHPLVGAEVISIFEILFLQISQYYM